MIKLKLVSLLAILFFFAYSGASAQVAAGKPNQQAEKLEFQFVNKFPVNIVHQYVFKDSTNVNRMYSDSSMFNYLQNIDYNFSEKAPNRPDDQGNFSLDVSIDSIYFRFNSPNKKAEYNSAWDEGTPPFNIRNFERCSAPMGMEYAMQYSPYDEVTKISGDRLASKLKDLNDPKDGLKDSIRRYVWLGGLNDRNLEFIADVNKNFLPENKVTPDTFWITTVKCRVDDVYFIDTVKMKVKSYTTKMYKLTGESIGRYLEKSPMLVYNMDKFVTPAFISGTSTYSMNLTPKGTIELLEAKYDLNLLLHYKNEPIVHIIKSNQKWILIDRYNY
ncbi:MAG: hypothetical protein WCR42_03305 [bacterium]